MCMYIMQESLSADSDHEHVLEDFTWLPNSIPDQCRIIITCTTGSPHYDFFTNNYNSKVEHRNFENNIYLLHFCHFCGNWNRVEVD